MIYYAKSRQKNGKHPTVKEHLEDVRDKAEEYGSEIDLKEEAAIAGLLHDFGKYSTEFQGVLEGTESGIDHAVGGALYLYRPGKSGSRSIQKPLVLIPIMEAVRGHHEGLTNWDSFREDFYQVKEYGKWDAVKMQKQWSIGSKEQYETAAEAFKADFPEFKRPKNLPDPPSHDGDYANRIRSMLYTRFLFSCLVDADYSVSAHEADADGENYFDRSENSCFDAEEALRKMNEYREEIKRVSTAAESVNTIREQVFNACGAAGEGQEGLYTLTAPTGTGKTLALLHFALRHCLKTGKQRIILVLPFLTLAEQNTEVYRKIVPDLLVDHSQSNLPDSMRELAARWRTPFIITTSVRFFETLFASVPTDCRKLHNIANSVVVFDEAQSLPAELTLSTLNAVKELCSRWHVTMLFSTATQPDYDAIPTLAWNPTEILPDHEVLYRVLRRTRIEWRIEPGKRTALSGIAEEMAAESNVCAIVNLRKHAVSLFESLKRKLSDNAGLFMLSTDLCPAHREHVMDMIRERQKKHLPCYVVSTQCIEAGVDLDFDTLYRALAPLESIIQAAGRCNRNGRSPDGGRVTVFVPDEEKLYPETWYAKGAETVQRMYSDCSAQGTALDLHSPDTIRAYYRQLFSGQNEKDDLVSAIQSRDFPGTDRAYELITKRGVRVLVPYADKTELFESVRKRMLEGGLTAALMKEAAPITVTTFEKDISRWTEPVRFRNEKEQESESGWYVLCPQFYGLYREDEGLQFVPPTVEKIEQDFLPVF
ncbi:MAG: CRISPR-associated helicase Cas3' [Clostridia bacterium]|nr:CRISPR-associated helicase Cas3' [Clostridia bacterium]